MSSKFQKVFIRVVAVILALLMVGSVLTIALSSSAGATTKDELKKLQDELKSLQQDQKDLKSQINSLEYEQSTIVAKKGVLDERIALTVSAIDNLTAQIEQYGILIQEKEAEVAQRESAEQAQWDKYKIRLRAMEENGTVSYYAIIFGANDFADMLSRIDMISSIMDYDNALYDKLVTAREATEDAKAQLEDTKAEAEGKKVELQDAQQELELQRNEANALIDALADDIDAAQDIYNQMEKDESQLKKDIAKAEEELKRQNAQVVGTGSFMWPVKSNIVTSGFGGRNTGIPGASTNHKGIDIGGTGYNAPIYAADTGKVTIASRNSSQGNYVTISHGNGITTTYAHMTKYVVKTGQTVTKGQIIGYTGATGVANGPHLHFEIRINGTPVNPLNYFKAGTYVVR